MPDKESTTRMEMKNRKKEKSEKPHDWNGVGEIQACQVEIVQGGGERTARRGGRGRGGRKVAGVHKQGSRNWGAKVSMGTMQQG